MKRLSFRRQYTSIVKEIHKKTMEPVHKGKPKSSLANIDNEARLKESLSKQSSIYGEDESIPLRVDGKMKYH